VLFFLVFGALLIKTVVLQRTAYDQLAASISRIDKISLYQNDDKLITTVKILGESDHLYQLQIKYKSNSFVVRELTSSRQNIPMKHKVQIVDLEMPFTQLSTLYREALDAYVPSFKREIDFEEFIDVVATLRVIKHRSYPLLTLIRLHLGKSEKVASARFRFRCNQDSCQVVQDGQDVQGDVSGEK